MATKRNPIDLSALPACAVEFLQSLVRKMRHRRKASEEVQAELAAHFEDELKACSTPQEKEQKARRVIEEFGDLKLLATLCRRAKKRCRPLWAKAIVRSLQAGGAMLVLFGVYAIWFFSGKPIARTDYLALLNQMSRPQIAEQDNAWPHYRQAFTLLVEPADELLEIPGIKSSYSEHPDYADLSPAQQQAVSKWIEMNRAAWEQFHKASAKPYCCRAYEWGPDAKEPMLLNLLLPDLTPLRGLAFVGIWHSRVQRQQGQTATALEDCLAVARAGRHWQDSRMLIEQLVGLALSRIAHQEVLCILSRQDLPAAELTELQRKIAALYPGAYPLMDMEGERIAFLDTVQHVFTEGGPGGGHLCPGAKGVSSIRGEPPEQMDMMVWNAAALVHAGREQTVAKATEMFDLQKKRVQLTPYQRRDSRIPDAEEMLTVLSKYRYTLIHVLAPAVDRPAELAFQGRASHQAALTILALQRYRAAKGAYPAALDELKVAGYLEAVPGDPYSDRPLVYRAANDGFTLYSVGPNFEDDGGVSGTKRDGRSRRWADDGDTVFWPVP